MLTQLIKQQRFT